MAHWCQAVQLDGRHSDAHVAMGFIHQRRARRAQAIVAFNRALQHKERLKAWSTADIHCYIGLSWKGLGEIDKALAHWRNAVELDPDSEAAKAAREAIRRATGRR